MAAIRRVVHLMAGRRSMPHAQLAARLARKKVLLLLLLLLVLVVVVVRAA